MSRAGARVSDVLLQRVQKYKTSFFFTLSFSGFEVLAVDDDQVKTSLELFITASRLFLLSLSSS